MLRYEWIWKKTQATGHLNAKKMPMKAHENILVFYKKLPTYHPQKTTGHPPANYSTRKPHVQNRTELYGKVTKKITTGGYTDRYPRSVLRFPSDKQKCHPHPTQKPIDLIVYLIKTYSNEGDLILDSCIGSGTTAVGCVRTNRRFIGMEKNERYWNIANERVQKEIENLHKR